MTAVSGAAQLLRRGQSCRAGTDDRDFLAGAKFRRLGTDPAFEKAALDDVLFDLLDRDRRLVDAEHARGFAGRGTDAAGELGEIVGGVQLADGFFPAAAIDQIVPVGNEIVDGTAGVAERNAAIHAARALLAQLFFREILIDFEPVVHALQRPAGAGPVRASSP